MKPVKNNARQLFFIFSLLLLPMLLYRANVPFIFDDIPDIVERVALRGSFVDALTTAPYRAVTYLTYWIQYKLASDFVPGQMHMVNMTIHSLASVIFFLLLCRMGVKQTLAWFGAMGFACHPLMSEAVINISGRGTILVALFSLSCMYMLGKPETVICWKRLGLTLTLFVLALFSKEEAALLPAIVFFMLLRHNQTVRVSLKVSVPMAIVSAIYMSFRIFHKIDPGAAEASSMVSAFDYRMLQPVVWAKYLQMLLWPANQTVEHGITAGHWSMTVMGVMGTLVFLCLLLGAVLKYRSKYSVFAIWFAASLLPTSIIPLADPMREMRAYFPSIAVIALFMVYLDNHLTSDAGSHLGAKLAGVIGGFALALFMILTVQRASIWQNPVNLWAEAHHSTPSRTRPLDNLSMALFNENNYIRSEKMAKMSIEKNKLNTHAWNNMGLALKEQGRLNDAMTSFYMVVKLNPSLPKARTNLANVLLELGRIVEAEKMYRDDIAIDSNQPDAHYGLGYIYMNQKRFDAAITEFKAVIAINYCDYWALKNLSSIYQEKNDAATSALYAQKAAQCRQ